MKSNPILTIYTREGTNASNNEMTSNKSDQKGLQDVPPGSSRFKRPSFLQRAYLAGILHHPRDIVFLIRVVTSVMWSLTRLFCFELPYLVLTRFKYSSKQRPAAWGWWTSVFFAGLRSAATQMKTVYQLRFVGQLLQRIMPLQLVLVRHVKVSPVVKFKVNLEVLLRPERATLATIRQELRQRNGSDGAMNPSQEYLESMHPPASGAGPARLANMPDDIRALDADGTYTIRGEWIEATEDLKDSRPRSKTVIMYFHGGAEIFCSPRTHTHLLAQLAKANGPGTRIFSVDYALAPEAPFPSAIHDAFAAYLYLTEPNHAALTLDEDSAPHELAVDPRDIVVAGDSGGGHLAAGFMQYMIRYVQPSTGPKYELPHASILLSPWTDISSMLPAAGHTDWFCYCPGPIGVSPFDKKGFMEHKGTNFAKVLLCGDVDLVPNARNALGIDRCWEWYSHLARHPLVSPAHCQAGALQGMTNTLIQTATHDRLVDDSRLYAHRLGRENPGGLMRLELYKDMVHVHQIMGLFFRSSSTAIQNIARFIARSEHARDERETIQMRGKRSKPAAKRSASFLQKVSVRDQSKVSPVTLSSSSNDPSAEENPVPAFMLPSMVKEKGLDGVEWVMVEQDGQETAGGEGWPMSALVGSWPSSIAAELKEA